MTPKHFTRARRLVTKRSYYRLRLRKFMRMFRRNDRKLMSATPFELDQLSEDMTRYAAKMEWYNKKLTK